jgi:hypothetical protein
VVGLGGLLSSCFPEPGSESVAIPAVSCLTLATHTHCWATPLSLSTGFKHVTCGSTIKLQFDGIGGGQFRLQSHEVA